MESVLEKLSAWAQSQPDKRAWSFCDDLGNVSDVLTYAELERATTVLAHHLLGKCGLRAGERVLLVFFPGLHFTASLLACFKAGIIAVPVFPPDPQRLKKDLNHFVSIQSSSGASVVLTHTAYNHAKKLAGVLNVFSSSGEKWPDLKWIPVDDILSKGKSGGPTITASVAKSADQVAFLQYTSGSTSEPKGVMITHGNLAHNLTLIVRELKANTSTVNVSWLPQYHDMGLIGSYLGVIYCGGVGFYLSPISFLKNPLLWMGCISKYKGTHTQAPNFAYALSARKFKEAKVAPVLNLSSVQHMINAAEPVDAVAMANFYSIYSPLGLPKDVIVPTYGLAEHTVFVASGGASVVKVSKSALEANTVEVLESAATNSSQGLAMCSISPETLGAANAQMIVGCGFPARGEAVDLRIVDPESRTCLAEGSVGEIWVNSPSKALGYWNREEQSKEDFCASLTGDNPDGSSSRCGGEYLRTGDLGFLHRQELFICGRIKDLIIVRGSNHYPQDLERTAEKAESGYLRPGCSAAFAINGAAGTHTEGVVLVAEVKENVSPAKFHAVSESVRMAIAKDHGLTLSCMCLVATRSIAKTTSGKITRAGNRRAFLEGSLKILHRLDASQEAAVGAPAVASAASSSLAVTHDDGLHPDDLSTPTWMDSAAGAAGGGGAVETAGLVELPSFTPEEVRAMSIEEIGGHLETLLLGIAGQGPTSLTQPIDQDAALSVLGLDSMTVVQFKGALEGSFHCSIPDEFMFTSLATLANFSVAAKHGSLTEEQQRELEEGLAPAPGTGTSTIQLKDEPCCPWFLMCRR